MKKTLTTFAVLSATTLALASCSDGGSSSSAKGDDQINIVASTAIWGDIAEALTEGQDNITVTTILDNNQDDPHSYEATAKDLATLKEADLVVANGGGYDNWLTDHVEEHTPVVTAMPLTEGHHHDHDHEGEAASSSASTTEAEHHDHEGEAASSSASTTEAEDHDHEDHSHEGHDHEGEAASSSASTTEAEDHDHEDHSHEGHDHGGFNPHVWFDMRIVDGFAETLADELKKLDPELTIDPAKVEDKTTDFVKRMEALDKGDVILTESVAEGIIDQSGLNNVTPDGYADSVEREAEPSAADVAEAQKLINDGKVDILITNEQSHTSAAGTLIEAAKAKKITIVNVNETPDNNQDYFDYVDQVLTELEDATK